MRIDAPTREDVIEVALNMRRLDVSEFLASKEHESEDDLVDYLTKTYGDSETTFCAYLGDEPVVIGYIEPIGDGRLALGMFATEAFPRVAPGLAKFIKRRLLPKYWAQGFTSAMTYSIESYTSAHRWMAALGMEKVGEIKGPKGDTFYEFKMGRPDDVEG